MRLFISIQLSDGMRIEICRIQEVFRRHGVRGNYTKPENLHLTLAFIGEYPDPYSVLEVLDSLPFEPFSLSLRGIGAFGDLWWVGLEDNEPLRRYVKALRYALAGAGIPFDRKRFSPHITLIRRAVVGERGMPGVTVAPVTMTVESPCLMRSDRGKDGMIYTQLQ